MDKDEFVLGIVVRLAEGEAHGVEADSQRDSDPTIAVWPEFVDTIGRDCQVARRRRRPATRPEWLAAISSNGELEVACAH